MREGKNITIGGHYFPQVFGSSLPGPIWKAAMEAALASVPPSTFDLVTLDGLGTYQPPPPPAPSSSPAAPSGSPSGSPAPGGSPTPDPKPDPTPTTQPTPSPTKKP